MMKRKQQYDKLAEHVRKYVDIPRLYQILSAWIIAYDGFSIFFSANTYHKSLRMPLFKGFLRF